MAAVADIFRFMDQIAPFEMQEDFDNAGFLVGRGNQAVQKILVALDITGEVAAEAVRLGAELIVAHHPVIFNPVKSVTDGTLTGPAYQHLAALQRAVSCRLTASGGISCNGEICRLRDMGLHAAIIGKAYYTGAIDLAQAVKDGGPQ